MNWMDDFISQCLTEVPKGKYRTRTEKELRDHMETLRRSCSEEEVLSRMGDPERLRCEYKAAWKRSPEGRANLIVNGCVMIWALMFVTAGLLEWFNERLYLSGTLMWVALLYLIPFTSGAAYLRACLREERRRVRWVTLGLLVEWAWVNASYLAVCAVMAAKLPADIDYWNFPGLAVYLLASLAYCLILGLFFGWRRERSLA